MGVRTRSVVVVGGGLAGIAASIRLADAGVRVTLIDAAKTLGGRASSFHDPELGPTDRGQHVTMGCCHAHLALMDRLGVRDAWRFSTEQAWIDARGRTTRVRPSALPGPLAFAPSLGTARFLSVRDRLSLAAFAPTLLRGATKTGETFGTFLRRHRMPESVIINLWEPVSVGACNLGVDRVCAALALSVVRRGFTSGPAAAAVGVCAKPLGDLYARVPEIVSDGGGTVLLGTSVVGFDARRVRLRAGPVLRADAVVCALPPRQAASLVDPGARDERFDAIAGLGSSSIVCAHLAFDRPVIDRPHAVLLGRTVQWVFRNADGRRVAAVISDADGLATLKRDELAARIETDVRDVLPRARSARLTRHKIVWEREATFAATPRAQSVRPGTTGTSGVLLAGDYTDTGWPATMEGAVLSGEAAAAAIA